MKYSLFALLMVGAALVGAPAAGANFGVGVGFYFGFGTRQESREEEAVAKKVEAPAVVDEDVAEPSNIGSVTTEYKCEMGNALTVFTNNDDDHHIALKWGKRLHRMTRVGTTTGASRFENKYYGLVWIGIPSKGILLDSKNGHQLATDCKSPEQMKPPVEVPKTPIQESGAKQS